MIGMLIKQAAENCAKESASAGIFSGTVMSASPLSIQVDERFLLTEEYLLVPSYLNGLILSAAGAAAGETELRKPLQKGDKVILLEAGGRYLVVGKEEGNGGRTVSIQLA